ncbi:hypothetical protein AGMMS49975_22160 [Clostridia bacterium]|nr:hypothetical protein AGMMS49975_22160 [Clostridia bacterium]
MSGVSVVDIIYNSDCMTGMRKLPDDCIDLIVTDPPYIMESRGCGFIRNRNVTALSEIQDAGLADGFDTAVFSEFMRLMERPNIYIWCAARQIPVCIDFFVNENGCKFDIIIWQKTNPMPLFSGKWLTDKEYCLYFRKGGYCNPVTFDDARTVFTQPVNAKDKNIYNHPTIKPLNIIETLIKNSSREGDVVLDPFMGSGTTALAAAKNNRRYIGFEINETYCKTATERVNDYKRRFLT